MKAQKVTKPIDDAIEELTDYLHIRKRINMYLGSSDNHTQDIMEIVDGKPTIKTVTWVPALYTGFREILDNSADEVIGKGYGNQIDITYDDKKFIFSVKDNGRGIPFDFDPTKNIHIATMVLTRPRTGRNFNQRTGVAGANGIGSKGTSNTSAWFEVEIDRNGENFSQRYTENLKGENLNISDPVIIPSNSPSGTYIKYSPSKTVYKTFNLPMEFVKSRVTEFAFVNPSIKVTFNGDLIKTKHDIQKGLFSDFRSIKIKIDSKEHNFKSEYILVPNFTESDEIYHSIVNNIFAFEGGTQIDSFRLGFAKGLISALEKESKRRKLYPNRADIMEKLLVFNVVKMDAPDFGSQSKTRLSNEYVGKIISSYLADGEIYKEIIKNNPQWIEEIFERCAERTKKKDASEIAKLSRKLAKIKVNKLIEATGKNRKKCIAILTEGDSSAGKISEARDPEIHGILPLRGKLLNVNGVSTKEAFNNKVLQDIMNVFGLTIGKKADINSMNYGKLWVAADADEDGKNISALIVNFFYTYWPELFSGPEPFLFLFQTPLIIAHKGKETKYWYTDNYDTFDQKKYSKKTGWDITRAKGLGSLESEDWIHCISSPNLFPITDDGELKDSLDLIFNKTKASDRKDWMD